MLPEPCKVQGNQATNEVPGGIRKEDFGIWRKYAKAGFNPAFRIPHF
jgi:hypothetical protein